MLKHRDLTVRRIGRFTRRLQNYIYTNPRPLKLSYLYSKEPIAFREARKGKFKAISVGTEWGTQFDCAWFQIKGIVPKSFRGRNVVAIIDLGGEACLFSKTGKPLQGLTAKFPESHGGFIGSKKEIKLFEQAKGGEVVDLMLDAGANLLLGQQRICEINKAEICEFSETAHKLYHEYRFLEMFMQALPEDSRQGQLILRSLNDVCNMISEFSEAEMTKARERLSVELKRPAVDSALSVTAIGHAHMDVAWLWPLRETVRKCGRTFATALRMMEEYPDYHFGASQPHLYQMTKDNYPALYKEIKAAVKAGRWEVQDGMWVESDCNIPSGESFVRQVLHGKRFYQQEFGIDVKHLWLPDVFGYSAALPQILKQSGIDYFTTHKLNWNQFNQFPHHTMYWQGIDGTKIFSHFMTGNDYNVPSTPQSFMNFESKNKDGDRTDHALCLFGIGDGGGGPGRTHIEWTKLAENLQGLPKVTMEKAADFFPKAEANSRDLLTWVGELYFEYHRGTYTTQALVKKMNRRLELLIREVEFSFSRLPHRMASRYPCKQLERIWKVILLNQFHDIIPGSSITRVYDEAHIQYREAEKELTKLLEQADSLYAKSIDTGNVEGAIVLSNSLSWDRYAVVKLAGEKRTKWESAEGSPLISQRVKGGVMVAADVPMMGAAIIYATEKMAVVPNALSVSELSLENEVFRIDLHPKGGIRRVFDKQQKREVLNGGRGNHFSLYEDLPLDYEAWDIDAYYLEKEPSHPELISSEVVDQGPLMVSVKQVYRAGSYSIVQFIKLYSQGNSQSRLIEFETEIDWNESQKMLRVDFPVNVYASEANYEIQFGHVARPTHSNTSWDMAKFEVVAHKWADISQPNYGVAILNDCKYGHRIQGNTISLNLLRSPLSPDPKADRHKHQFKYAIYPHVGTHIEARVVNVASEFNVPARFIKAIPSAGELESVGSFISCSSDNVIIDTIKQAEDGQDIIIRMYESAGIDCNVDITTGSKYQQICEVDLMEQNEKRQKTKNKGQTVKLKFTPFQIRTLKCKQPL